MALHFEIGKIQHAKTPANSTFLRRLYQKTVEDGPKPVADQAGTVDSGEPLDMSIQTFSNATLSVIIPTFNRAWILPEAIRSVISQNIPGTEIVLIDDGSTDDTGAIVKRFENQITIRHIAQPRQGPAQARNRGISMASGEIVCFLDSDDIFYEGKLQRDLDILASDTSLEVVVSNADYHLDNRCITKSWFSRKGVPTPTARSPFLWDPGCPAWVWGSVFPTSGISMRSRALRRLGNDPFPESSEEDWMFEVNLLGQLRVVLLPEPLVGIRRFTSRDHLSLDLDPKDPLIRQKSLNDRIAVLIEAAKAYSWSPAVELELAKAIAVARYALENGDIRPPWNDSSQWIDSDAPSS